MNENVFSLRKLKSQIELHLRECHPKLNTNQSWCDVFCWRFLVQICIAHPIITKQQTKVLRGCEIRYIYMNFK